MSIKKHSLDPFMIPKHYIMYQGGSSKLFKAGICTSMLLRDMTSVSHVVEAQAVVLNSMGTLLSNQAARGVSCLVTDEDPRGRNVSL